jgi:hypothetical protein
VSFAEPQLSLDEAIDRSVSLTAAHAPTRVEPHQKCAPALLVGAPLCDVDVLACGVIAAARDRAVGGRGPDHRNRGYDANRRHRREVCRFMATLDKGSCRIQEGWSRSTGNDSSARLGSTRRGGLTASRRLPSAPNVSML